ncbi:hypothetical protein KAW55_06500 [bacterium]|nr:hypothetical protein [bacterium]MCK4326389.1 hypothetical protein [bacterium]
MEKGTLERTVDKIALEVSKHTKAIEGLATKEEFTEFKSENLTRLDKVLTILDRLDQERLFTFERVRRIEEEVEKIKAHLSID